MVSADDGSLAWTCEPVKTLAIEIMQLSGCGWQLLFWDSNIGWWFWWMVKWVSSTWLGEMFGSAVVRAKSFKSSRKSPLRVSWRGTVNLNFLEINRWSSVSIMAPNALSKVFDKRNGVDPGTMAILRFNPCMGTTMAYWLCKVPWLPKRKVILHGHLVIRLRMPSSILSRNSLTWLLPMTVLVAPRSTTPRLPCVAKQVTAVSSLSGCAGLCDLWALQCKLCRMAGLSSRFLTVATAFGSVVWMRFMVCASLKRALCISSCILGITVKHGHSNWVASKAVPAASGNSRNSKVSASVSWCSWETWTNEVGAVPGRLAEVTAWGFTVGSFLLGHSAFQWPYWSQMRQRDSMILLCRDFRDDGCPLWNFPLPPLWPEPFPFPFRGGQNPRDFILSLNLRLASV